MLLQCTTHMFLNYYYERKNKPEIGTQVEKNW